MPATTQPAETNLDDLQACEHCGSVHNIEAMTGTDDGCWFCPACVAKWNPPAIQAESL